MTTKNSRPAVRVCAIADIECSHGCDTGPCKREAESSRPAAAPIGEPCQGTNCGCTDGKSHSMECIEQHSATVDGNGPAPSPADERAARVSLLLTHEQVSALYVHLAHRNRPEFGWIESPLVAIEEALKPTHNAIHDRGFNAMNRQFFSDDRFKFDEAEMPSEIVPQARAASASQPVDERAAFKAALDKRAKSAGFEVGRMTECELDNAWWGWQAARAASARETGAEAVAIVDESDDGLFVEILYGENGSSLKLGDKLYAAPQPAQAGMPVLTNAMRAVITNESGAYQSADDLYAALCAAAGVEHPAQADARVGLTAEQREAIEYAVTWLDENVSNRYAYTAAKELRALLATSPGQPEPRAEVTEEQPSLTNPLTPYGMLVRALRIVSGTTLMDMAEHLGRGPAELSAIEFGRKPVRDADIVDAAHFFACVGIQSTTHALTIAARTGASS